MVCEGGGQPENHTGLPRGRQQQLGGKISLNARRTWSGGVQGQSLLEQPAGDRGPWA